MKRERREEWEGAVHGLDINPLVVTLLSPSPSDARGRKWIIPAGESAEVTRWGGHEWE